MTQGGVCKWCGAAGVALLIGIAAPAVARAYSLLPLVTEEAQTLPSGVAEGILGVAYFKDLRFPAFTPAGALRSQTLLGLPQFGFRIGAGGWVEIQASYEVLYLDETAANGQTNWQYDSGDIRLSTKGWIARQRGFWPALGVRFGTKLPNASRKRGLGTDDTDFGIDALVSEDFGPCAVHANMGLLLLGNSGPIIGHSFDAGGQDDLFNYSLAVTSAWLGQPAPGAALLRLVAELAGQTGSRFGNDRTAIRAGLQIQQGHGTVYLGVSTGLITASENIGASTGFIYTFEPGKLLGME
jgi:hypothetical protein